MENNNEQIPLKRGRGRPKSDKTKTEEAIKLSIHERILLGVLVKYWLKTNNLLGS